MIFEIRVAFLLQFGKYLQTMAHHCHKYRPMPFLKILKCENKILVDKRWITGPHPDHHQFSKTINCPFINHKSLQVMPSSPPQTLVNLPI